DVHARRREQRIGVRRNDTIHPEFFGNLPEFGNVVTTLREFKRRHQSKEGALQWRRARWSAKEARLFPKCKIHFRAGTIHLDSANSGEEFGWQLRGRHEFLERAFWVRVRKNAARG